MYSFSERVSAMNHDSADNIRVRAAESLVSVHWNVQKSVRVGIGTASATDVSNGNLSNVEDFVDAIDKCLWSQTPGATTIGDRIQSSIPRSRQNCSILGIVKPRIKIRDFARKNVLVVLAWLLAGMGPCRSKSNWYWGPSIVWRQVMRPRQCGWEVSWLQECGTWWWIQWCP